MRGCSASCVVVSRDGFKRTDERHWEITGNRISTNHQLKAIAPNRLASLQVICVFVDSM
jgi:hypothetical protein